MLTYAPHKSISHLLRSLEQGHGIATDLGLAYEQLATEFVEEIISELSRMKPRPIATATKDETTRMLFYPDRGWIRGWWFSSPKQIDDGWETFLGFIGEPTYWLPDLPDPEDALAQPQSPTPKETTDAD